MKGPEHETEGGRSHPLSVQPEAPVEEEIDLLDYVEVVVRRRWMIFWSVFVCAFVAYFHALTQPRIFQAEAIILTAEERGFLELGGDPEQINHRSFYLDILKSTSLNRNILQKVYPYTLDGESYETTLLEYVKAKTLQGGTHALLGMAGFVSDRSGVIAIVVETRSPELSAAVANQYVEQLILYNQEKQQAYTRSQLTFIEKRMAELQDELAGAEEALADFQNRNSLTLDGGAFFLTPEQAVEHSRLKRAVETRSSLLSTVMNQYEVVRVEAKKEVSGIEVLNYAEPPELGSGLGKKKAVMISSAVGFFVTVFLAFLLEYIERNRQSGRLEPIVKELEKDVKRVRRLLGNRGGEEN